MWFIIWWFDTFWYYGAMRLIDQQQNPNTCFNKAWLGPWCLTLTGKTSGCLNDVQHQKAQWLPLGAATHTICLPELSDIYTKWRHVREDEWPLVQMNFDQPEDRRFSLRGCDGRLQERGNFDIRKCRKGYVSLSKLNKETAFITTGKFLKSGVFRIQWFSRHSPWAWFREAESSRTSSLVR